MNQVRNYSNKERIAVVTGSRKGIGKAIAMEFANMLSMTRNMMSIKEDQSGYSEGMKARMEAQVLYLINDLHHGVIESYGIV